MAEPFHSVEGSSTAEEATVDCDRGREMGCGTYCCRLIVRLEPLEPAPGCPSDTNKRCVDKDPKTGWCVHLNVANHSCGVWAQRPRVCRAYDCNSDALLQVVLEQGFVDLRTLVKARRRRGAPNRLVPYRVRGGVP